MRLTLSRIVNWLVLNNGVHMVRHKFDLFGVSKLTSHVHTGEYRGTWLSVGWAFEWWISIPSVCKYEFGDVTGVTLYRGYILYLVNLKNCLSLLKKHRFKGRRLSAHAAGNLLGSCGVMIQLVESNMYWWYSKPHKHLFCPKKVVGVSNTFFLAVFWAL